MGVSRFLEALQRSERLVLDGAMGTELYVRGHPFSVNYEQLNLSRPDEIRAIHAASVAAGADVVETNTFGANRARLGRHGLEDRVREINRAGVEHARASGARFVAGAIGPSGLVDERVFREQADALADAGADLLIVETMRHLAELHVAVAAARKTGLPVVGFASFTDDLVLADGTTPEQVAAAIEADLIGANCSEHLVDVAARMRAGAIMPNGGQPGALRDLDGFGRDVERFFALGVRLVGGCCGTGPAHVAAIRARAPR